MWQRTLCNLLVAFFMVPCSGSPQGKDGLVPGPVVAWVLVRDQRPKRSCHRSSSASVSRARRQSRSTAKASR